MIAGTIIGIERQWRKKLAGIRTMSLVTLGATLFVLLSSMIELDSSPTRIAAQVVSGIGFLAGGVILRDGFSVTGLNTAATLWCAAAVGSLIGAGFRIEGLVAAVAITAVNIIIRLLSYKIDRLTQEDNQILSNHQPIYLSIVGKSSAELVLRTEIIQLLDRHYLKFCHFSCTDLAGEKVRLSIEIEPVAHIKPSTQKIVTHLSQQAEVLEIQQIAEGESSW